MIKANEAYARTEANITNIKTIAYSYMDELAPSIEKEILNATRDCSKYCTITINRVDLASKGITSEDQKKYFNTYAKAYLTALGYAVTAHETFSGGVAIAICWEEV